MQIIYAQEKEKNNKYERKYIQHTVYIQEVYTLRVCEYQSQRK